MVNKKEDFERGSGEGIVIGEQGLFLADGCSAGVYDTRVFDSGECGMRWHRLRIYGSALKGNASVTLYAADKEEEVLLKTAEKKRIRNPEDALLDGVEGRYVRLKIRMEKKSGAQVGISRIRICFPQETWLSYLPEIYCENVSEDSFFLRYLGIFQALYEDMTERIRHIPQYFSPFTKSREALYELSGWFDLKNGELWNEEQRRYLILHAARLLRIRGTVEYLKELILLGTGRTVYIVEYGQLLPYFDGGETEECLKRLYCLSPYEFTVLVDRKGQAEEGELYLIGKIAEMAKPAYMECRIVAPPPYLFLGQHTYLGINSVLGRYRTLCLNGKCAMPFSVIAGEGGGQ